MSFRVIGTRERSSSYTNYNSIQVVVPVTTLILGDFVGPLSEYLGTVGGGTE